MHVASGKAIDVSKPNLGEIVLDDIAWSLAHTLRFNGHLKHQISVARHSIYVAELVPDYCKLAALLHDAHEAYLGDIVRPVKAFLLMSGVRVDDLEKLWQHQIWKRFGCLPGDFYEEQAIIEADDLQLAREMAFYAPEGDFRDYGKHWLETSTYAKVEPLLPHRVDPEQDYHDFLKRFEDLFTVDHMSESM